MAESAHRLRAVAFVENLSLKQLEAAFPASRRTAHHLRVGLGDDGEVFVYPFGAAVFCDVPRPREEQILRKLDQAHGAGLTTSVLTEELTVREARDEAPHMQDGVLTVDQLTPDRTSVLALVIAQSAAMEHYETIVEQMFVATDQLAGQLETRGTVAWRTRHLHRFIGQAVGTRNEVLSVLHLLDRPDETWDDPATGRIYDELRAEFDLVDRYQALALKLRSVQETLELVLGVARDRRLVLLEAAIIVLIVVEIVLALLQFR